MLKMEKEVGFSLPREMNLSKLWGEIHQRNSPSLSRIWFEEMGEMKPRVYPKSLNRTHACIKQNFKIFRYAVIDCSKLDSNIWGQLALIIHIWISNVQEQHNFFQYFACLISRNSLLKWTNFQIFKSSRVLINPLLLPRV